MRHHKSGRKLGRDASHRKALYANLTSALIEHGRIKTTVAKAKEVRPVAEEMITLGRRGDVPARRQALKFLRSQDVVHKLFSEVGPRFSDRPGGYSRIVKLGPRQGDAAEMAYLELVDEEYVAREREARTPEPVAVEEPVAEAEPEAVEEPVSTEPVSDAGADESADDGDDAAGDADEAEGLDEAGAEEAPADPGEPD